MDARYIAVLEIGSSKVKGAVARVDSDGGATLVATHEVKTINCVRHGRVQNVQEVASRVDEVLRRLENDPAVAPRRVRRVRIALGGRSMASVAAEAEATLPAEVEITAEIVERLKRDAVMGLPADRQVMAVLPRGFNVDGAAVSNAVGIFGRNIHADMTVLLCSPDNRTNLERVATAVESRPEAARVERVYVPRQLALARMALTPSEQQLGVALVDLGAETTTVSVHKDGTALVAVTLPMGSRNITRDIAAALGVTEEQAEYIKCAQASAMADTDSNASTPDAREINAYTQARAGEIIANVLHRIESAGFKLSELGAGIVLTGRGAQMRRMADLFAAQTKMKVRLATADNSVRPGATGATPVADIDIMALAAWPAGCADSDLTEPATAAMADDTADDADYDPYDPRRAAASARARRGAELDDESVLDDDPDDFEEENAPARRRDKKKIRRQEPETTEDMDDDDDADYDGKDTATGKSRFEGLRNLVSRLGRGFIGETGPDDIDD